MVTASQASLDIVVAVVGVVAVFLHHDGKAHGVYLRILYEFYVHFFCIK